MKVSMFQYLVGKFADRFGRLFTMLGRMESGLLSNELASFTPGPPVYVTGLARSGTTILLEMLHSLGSFASYKYNDYPFMDVPYFWNKFLRSAQKSSIQPQERAHGDGIYITPFSPEAMEEPLWRRFFPHVHSLQTTHGLDGFSTGRFKKYYENTLKKLCLVHKKKRVLIKNNYNVLRMDAIKSMLGDSLFLVVVRNPLSHVESLLRQNLLFQKLHKENPKQRVVMKNICHFEFGLDTHPIIVTEESRKDLLDSLKKEDWVRYYAMQWRDIYNYIRTLADESNESSVHVVRHEDFCDNFVETFLKIVSLLRINVEDEIIDVLSAKVRQSRQPELPEVQRELIMEITSGVAKGYGYF